MALTAREAKYLATTANSLEKVVRLLQTMNDNLVEMALRFDSFTKEMSREVDLDKLVEDSKKIAEAGKVFDENRNFVARLPSELDPNPPVLDANQLEIPKIVTTQSMRYNDKYTPDDQGRLKPHEWRWNLGIEGFFDVHSPHENDLMTEEAFRIYNVGL
jgi:hypothetical protein